MAAIVLNVNDIKEYNAIIRPVIGIDLAKLYTTSRRLVGQRENDNQEPSETMVQDVF